MNYILDHVWYISMMMMMMMMAGPVSPNRHIRSWVNQVLDLSIYTIVYSVHIDLLPTAYCDKITTRV